ncbi:MAG: DNA-3-methyladenine glycosylase, partial [Ruminococcus sp.]|nr:DNA-3-methyladenine glycosylase [Ruminococcus sp.]
MNVKLTEKFFRRDCLEVAPELVGKILVRKLPDGTLIKERISETEAYRG